MAAVLAVVFGVVAVGVLSPLGDKPMPDAARAGLWQSAAGTLVPAAIVLGAVVYLSVSASAWVRRLAAEVDAAVAEAKTFCDRRRSCCLGDGVAYLSWEGSIHTFLFFGVGYTEAFASENDGKMLVS